MLKPWLPLLLLLLPALASGEKERPFIDEGRYQRDDIVEPEYWKEGGSELPPLPKESDLVEIRLDAPGARFSYLIDATHLSIGNDKVVRYTLVARSKTGSENVSFQGLRCDSPEYKIFAYGTRGGFKRVEGVDWQRIGPSDADQVQRELQRFYLCQPSHHIPRERSEMIWALRGQVNLHDTGFIPD
jgi:hypothetical protein